MAQLGEAYKPYFVGEVSQCLCSSTFKSTGTCPMHYRKFTSLRYADEEDTVIGSKVKLSRASSITV